MNINEALFIYINQHMQNPTLDMIMPTVTHFGGFIFLILLVVALIIFSVITKRDTLKKVAIIALIALLVSDVIVLALKNLVHEPRPFLALENVRLLVPEEDPNSFPSGHAASTLAVVSVFLLNMDDLVKKYQIVIDIVLAIFAVLVVISRVYCGVHYPDDVIVGALIGIFGAFIVNRFHDRIFEFVK